MFYFITMAESSLASAFSDFVSIFGSAWTFLQGNWYFFALLIIPLGVYIIRAVISAIRG